MSIIVKFSGGLGNQMFQYAFLKGLKERYKNITCLGDKIKGYKENPDHYGFELNRIFTKIHIDEATEAEILSTADYSMNFISRVRRKFFRKKSHIKNYNLQFVRYEINNLQNIYFDGYWQSYKYFPEKNTLIHDFQFNIDNTKASKYVNLITESNSVGLHIRGNDYISNPNTYKLLGSVIDQSDYYNNAIKFCIEKIENPVFFIFTDDIEYASQVITNIDYKINTIIVDDFHSKDDYYYKIYLMSICKHNIIGNSTFAWWGAWLNINKNAIICCPDKWINHTSYEIEDIIPDNFIKIPFNKK